MGEPSIVLDALVEAQAREQARLAAEGYRFYAGEAIEFAEASAGAVAETMAFNLALG